MTKIKSNILLGIFCMAVSIFLVTCSYYNGMRYVGDTALFAQITKNIAYLGKAESNIYANTQDFIDRGIAGMPIDERMASEEAFTPPKEQTRNILQFHAYYILYLLAPLCYFMSSFTCVTIAQSIAMALSLFFSILLMREKKIPIAVIGVTCLMLISHPGWSMPAVYGAFYPDRLFMATGMYLVWACDKENFSKIHFVISALLCLLVGERGALYAGMFILAYTVFYWGEKKEGRGIKIGFGIGLVSYAGIMLKLVLSNLYYSDLGGQLNFLSYLSDPTNRQRVVLFFIINVLLFALVGIVEWRAFVIGCASMIPNLIYNLGGAEKIGWTLHYHVFYFVFLMWAVTKGSIKLYKMFESKIENKAMKCLPSVFLMLCFSTLISLIDPVDLSVDFSIRNMKNNILINSIAEIKYTYFSGGKELREGYNEFIQNNIPEDSQVTTIEQAMVDLQDRNIYLLPLGIDTANVAIMTYSLINDEPIFGGSVIYGTAEDNRVFNKWVMEHMKDIGYDFDNAKIYPAYGVAIIERK